METSILLQIMVRCLWLALINALMQGVFCEVWKVTMPQRIMGVEGSCVLVPCRFEIPKEYEPQLSNCSGRAVWKQRDILGSINKAGDLVGDLRQKNCTTVFRNFTKEENDFYFFRLDCKNALKYNFNKGIHISVTPGVALSNLTSVTSVSHVTEGSEVMMQCIAMVPCPFLPPSISWAAPQSRTQKQILQSSDGQMMLKSMLTFAATAHHHNQTVTCSVSYPLSAGGSTEAFATSHSLHISYGPRSTLAELSVSSPVSEGRVVVFTCSSDANPPVTTYTWFSNTNGTAVKVGEGRMLPLQVRQAHSGLYQCQAQNERGAQLSNSLLLEVHHLKGFHTSVALWISGVCGVISLLCVFTVAVLSYKYRSLSRKLKHLEQREEHIYSNLQNSTITPDYDSLKPRPTTVMTPAEDLNYENCTVLH